MLRVEPHRMPSSWVSSANWEMRCSTSTPLIWMPSISGAVSIMRVSASATTRKARGEKGHPCGGHVS
eukprot:scaffold34882_cov152-Isochrysis_galbana.AAC.2